MRTLMLGVAALALMIAACQPGDPATAQTPTPKAGAPVPQAAPNKKDAVPAFAGQTRAPEHKSSFTPKVTRIAGGIPHPWAMALLPDGAFLITSKTGKLWVVTAKGERSEVAGVPQVDARSQGGLMDISLGPDFAAKRTVWFTYSEPRGGGRTGTTLAKAQLSKDRKKLEGVTTVFQQKPDWATPMQYGSNIEWDSAGNIFLTLGERYSPESRQHAQNITDDFGKVVHIKPDGAPAPGNPFIGRKDAAPEIWSIGHRNPQGAAINPDTGKLWTIEHGPRGGDEINVPAPGKNYGWPITTYGIDYPGGPIGDGITKKDGLEQPIYYWDPVIAPGDMIFYKGSLFPWKGNVVIAALSGGIVRLEVSGEKIVGEERLLQDQGRIRDVQEAADGALWLVMDDDDGELLRVTPG